MLEFLYEQNKEVNQKDLNTKFPTASFGELFDTLGALYDKGFADSPKQNVWVITKQGRIAFEKMNNNDTIFYQKWSFWIGVVLGTAIALTALLVAIYKK